MTRIGISHSRPGEDTLRRIIFIGPPGAGKGTQAGRIRDRYGIAWISTGGMFREAISAGTPMGEKACKYVETGELVPDDVVVGLVIERLQRPDCARGFLLDGFPRTVVQAKALDEALADPIGMVIVLEVPKPLLVERLAKRAEVEGRADDSSETVRNRLLIYEEETAPVVDYYRNTPGLVVDVDGVGTMDEVAERINSALG